MPAYYAGIDSDRLAVEKGLRLSADDLLRREVIAGIMCSGELDFAGIGTRYHIDFATYFADAMKQMEAMREDGLVSFDHRSLQVTCSGRFLLRNIAMPFDAHLRTKSMQQDNQPTPFSRVI